MIIRCDNFLIAAYYCPIVVVAVVVCVMAEAVAVVLLEQMNTIIPAREPHSLLGPVGVAVQPNRMQTNTISRRKFGVIVS